MSRRHRGVRLRRAATLLLALILLAALWELYKLVIPDDAVRLGDTLILPRSDDTSMPQLSQIFSAFGKQEVAGASNTVASSVVSAVWYSLRLAAAGFAVGVAIGFLLALAMQRLRTVERALPYVVLSQTVPLVALAPLVYGWSGNLTLFGLDWQPWMSVAAISAYPAFFPVAIGALRGLSSLSPPPGGADRAAALLRRVVVADARAAAAARVGALQRVRPGPRGQEPQDGRPLHARGLQPHRLEHEGTAMLQDAIWANTEKLQGDKAYQDTTVKFLQARFKGWIYCRDNAEKCRDIVVARGSKLGASHQLWQMNEAPRTPTAPPSSPRRPSPPALAGPDPHGCLGAGRL